MSKFLMNPIIAHFNMLLQLIVSIIFTYWLRNGDISSNTDPRSSSIGIIYQQFSANHWNRANKQKNPLIFVQPHLDLVSVLNTDDTLKKKSYPGIYLLFRLTNSDFIIRIMALFVFVTINRLFVTSLNERVGEIQLTFCFNKINIYWIETVWIKTITNQRGNVMTFQYARVKIMSSVFIDSNTPDFRP